MQDSYSEDSFIEGMATAHDVVWTTVDRLQQSLNDVLGVYLDVPSKLMHEHPVVSELEVAHQVLNQFRERFVDNYDEAMGKHKAKEWQTDVEQLKSEWPK